MSDPAPFPATALVTGGGRGIGAGIALVLAGAGIRVITADLAGADAVFDVSDETSVAAMQAWALAELGSVDLLVCAAGVLTFGRVVDLSLADWEHVMAVNARGPFLCARAFAPDMCARRRGCVVTIASISGKEGDPDLAHYSASKAAAIAFTQSLAKELAPFGVRANAICPGTVRTPMLEHLCAARGETVDEIAARCQLLPHPQSPEEIGDAVLFLARSPSVTGQAVNVDGGNVFH